MKNQNKKIILIKLSILNILNKILIILIIIENFLVMQILKINFLFLLKNKHRYDVTFMTVNRFSKHFYSLSCIKKITTKNIIKLYVVYVYQIYKFSIHIRFLRKILQNFRHKTEAVNNCYI